VGIGILFVHKMDIVGGNELYLIFPCNADQLLVHPLLLGIGGSVGIGPVGLVALQLQVIIVAEHFLVPLHRLFRLTDLPAVDLTGNFSPQAGRGDDQPLMVLLQQLLVDAGTIVESFRPALGDDLDQVSVTLQVLGQHYQVPSAAVDFVRLGETVAPCQIALAPYDRFKELALRFLQFIGELFPFAGGFISCSQRLDLFSQFPYLRPVWSVLFVAIVQEFLDAVHRSVVRQGDGFHAVSRCFVDQTLNACLPVEKRILGVDV
jgi:hypothetical protein